MILVLAAVTLALLPLWWPAEPAPNVGRPPWPEPTRLSPRQAAARAAPALAETGSIEVHSARLADLEPVIPAHPPVRVSIPGLELAAQIVPVGVHPSGAIEVPPDIDTVGWYRFGPSPGLPGSSVLVGHVDSRSAGPGAFYELSRTHPGDVVRVQLAGGRWSAFEVVSRTLVSKDRLPLGTFTREGPPVLTLITCGGRFNREAGRYSDNVVVAAVPRGRS